jgi:hypothetical protein
VNTFLGHVQNSDALSAKNKDTMQGHVNLPDVNSVRNGNTDVRAG